METTKPNSKIKKLEAENAKLKSKLSKKKQAQAKHRRHILRKTSVIFLISLALALLVAGNILFWFGNTVVKNDRFVATVSPVIKDPQVQQTIALYATNSIFNNVNVQQNIENVLPPRADFLAPQLANQLKTVTNSSFQKVLAKPSFQDKFNQVLTRQHQRLINFTSKYQGDGDINVNDVFTQLTANLSDTKLAFLAGKQLPAKVGDVTLISAPWLPAFHNVVVNIDTWRTIAVVLLILCVAGAVYLSQKRRRTVYMFSVGAVLMMLATLIALRVARQTIVGEADPQYSAGVEQIFRITTHPFFIQTITIAAAAAAVGLIAWLSGTSPRAAWLKEHIGLLFGGQLHDKLFAPDNKYSLWVANHRRALQWSVLIVLTGLMLVVKLTLTSLIIYLIVLAVLLLVIDLVAGQTAKKLPARARAKA